MAETKKITIEIEVPGGVPGIETVVRDAVEKMIAYLILQTKAKGKISDDEIVEITREARRRVWERVKDAYTSR